MYPVDYPSMLFKYPDVACYTFSTAVIVMPGYNVRIRNIKPSRVTGPTQTGLHV